MEFLESRINKLLGEARKIEIDVAHHQISWSQWDLKQTGVRSVSLAELMRIISV